MNSDSKKRRSFLALLFATGDAKVHPPKKIFYIVTFGSQDMAHESLGIPQERIAKRLGIPRQTISDHLPKMAALPNPAYNNYSMNYVY